MPLNIFDEINNAVLDLQSSQLQTFVRPLKKLAFLLDSPNLQTYNIELTNEVDLKSFLKTSEETGGGMVGSAHLVWPEDSKESLGITLLLIKELASNPDDAIQFSHHYFYSSSKLISGIHSLTAQVIIPFVRDYKRYVESKGDIRAVVRSSLSSKVFIVHGHDDGARETVARFLERIGLEAIILHEQVSQGRTIIEKVVAHSDVGFAVVILTPDDEGCVIGGAATPRARQNVLLELGYFIGLLGRDKVCALKRGNLEIPSDFAGIVWQEMDNNGGWKRSLARELEAAGYNIDGNRVLRA